MPPNELTYAHLISRFTAFLTVAIHTILYERAIYSKESFLSARAYNFPVRQSRHPKVCQWITDAVAAVESELLNGTVARIAVVIFNPSTSKPLERFVFDLGKLPSVPRTEVGTPFAREDGRGEEAEAKGKQSDENAWVDLDEQLRGVLSKLAVCGSRLNPIPEGCTFTMAIELKDEADPPIGHPQPWIPSEPSLQREKKGGSEDETEGQSAAEDRKKALGKDLGGVRTVPLRAVDAGEMLFEVWVEEGKSKLDRSLQSSGNTSTSFGS